MFHLKQQCSIVHHPTEKGQNLVEFALVFGLIIIVFLGMIEMGNLFQEKADLDAVVRQAARQAGEFGGGSDQVKAYVLHQLDLLGYDAATVSITVTAQTLNSNGFIENTEDYTDVCSYGEFISVEIYKKWDAAFLASTQAFITQNPQSGVFRVVHTNRCWRAD